MSIRSLSLALVCSFALVLPVYQLALDQTSMPGFLGIGSFAQYKQEYSNGETHELRWEITTVEGSLVEIEVQSHGLFFNTTTELFDIVPGGGTLIIDKDTCEIQDAYYSNGTKIEGYPIGEKTAFWISPETNESTPINSMYERNAYASSTNPLEFDCLSSPRSCWMTENSYSVGNQMNRYYDQETGIVLRIETQRRVSLMEVSVLETLNGTNIGPLLAGPISDDLGGIISTLVIGLPVLFLIVLVLHFRRRGQ
ncbi:MAG: hypothetical protein JSW61_02750 [Candidatus Thorarchaeota archaeon]|nr:MAG: hypothetical protein JSW61_02750 [Candidatus Thorarchaeota archaeon]